MAYVGLSAVLAACGGTAPDETFSADGVRLLADVRHPSGGSLRFYEMEDGDIAAIGRIDDGNGGLIPGTSAEEAEGIADLYAAVAGAHADAAVLAKLAASDEATRIAAEPEQVREPALDEAEEPALRGASIDNSGISTRACTIQSAAFYAADAANYQANFCRTLDGLGSIHCELNVASFNDGWHRAKKYRSDSFNQTLCNTSIHLNKSNHGGHTRQFVNELGPRVHSIFTLNTSRDDMDFHTESRTTAGPEASHLCTSVNRRQ